MTATRALPLFSTLALLGACPSDADSRDGRDAGPVDTLAQLCEGPRKSRGPAWWVVNGTREPTLVPLSPAQREAVVSVNQSCSGTLIAERVVLTAQHCTGGMRPSDLEVRFGRDDSAPLLRAGVGELHEHSSRDLSLLVLDRDPTSLIAVEPVPIHVEPMSQSWVGERVEAAGYGLTSPGGGSDGRFFVAEPVYSVDAEFVAVTGQGERGVCYGDSGGPVMGIVGGSAVRVLGALSWGDSSCTGVDHFTRVDPVRAWIEGIAGTTPPVGPTPCGDVSVEGRCESDGARAIYCGGDGLLRRDDCAAAGQRCGWDNQARGFRCLDGPDPCDGADALGRCEGSTSVWCVGGVLTRFDCAQCDLQCAWVDQAIGHDCMADPCAGLDYLGRCSGDVAEWCVDGTLQSVDCAAYGQRCTWISDELGYYCTG